MMIVIILIPITGTTWHSSSIVQRGRNDITTTTTKRTVLLQIIQRSNSGKRGFDLWFFLRYYSAYWLLLWTAQEDECPLRSSPSWYHPLSLDSGPIVDMISCRFIVSNNTNSCRFCFFRLRIFCFSSAINIPFTRTRLLLPVVVIIPIFLRYSYYYNGNIVRYCNRYRYVERWTYLRWTLFNA